MTICDGSCEPICFACGLRAKGVAVTPSSTPSRTANRRQPRRPVQAPSWEKGIISDPRPDGSRMPILRPGSLRTPLRVKEYGENRRHFDAQIKRAKTGPLSA